MERQKKLSQKRCYTGVIGKFFTKMKISKRLRVLENKQSIKIQKKAGFAVHGGTNK